MLRFFEAIGKWRGKPELETVSSMFHHRFFRTFHPLRFDRSPLLFHILHHDPMSMD